MKKKRLTKAKWILLPCLALMMYIAFQFIYYNVAFESSQSFKVSEEADFYVVYNKGLKSYKFDGDTIHELNSQTLDVATSINPWQTKAELKNRYLIFSQGTSKMRKQDKALVSMDFEKGILKKVPTDYLVYLNGIQFNNNFYTYENKQNEFKLYQFNEEAKLIKTHTVNVDNEIYSVFSTSKQLYLVERAKDFDNSQMDLLALNEDVIQKSIPLLTNEGNEVYHFNSQVVVKDNLYIPIVKRTEKDTHTNVASNLLLKKSLEQDQMEWIELAATEPTQIFSSLSGNYLVVTHGGLEGKDGFSVVDVNTKATYFVDLVTLLADENSKISLDEHKIWHLNSTIDDKVVLLVDNELIIYDAKQQKRLVKEKISDDNEYRGIATWILKK